MEFVIGFLGALLSVALFGAGMAFGWRFHARLTEITQPVTAEELTEEQKQRLAEEKAAWKSIFDYSADVAYNMPHRTDAKEE